MRRSEVSATVVAMVEIPRFARTDPLPAASAVDYPPIHERSDSSANDAMYEVVTAR